MATLTQNPPARPRHRMGSGDAHRGHRRADLTMSRTTGWKSLTLGAALTGLSIVGSGAATATASTPIGVALTGLSVVSAGVAIFASNTPPQAVPRFDTARVRTAPDPSVGMGAANTKGQHGPFSNQNRGHGSAARKQVAA